MTDGKMRSGIRAAGWLSLFLGALILLAPFIFGVQQAAPLVSNILLGVVLAVAAGYSTWAASNVRPEERPMR